MLVWMKMQIHSLPLGAAFRAQRIAVSLLKLSTKQHCHCFIRHYRHDEMEMKSTNHCRLFSRKGKFYKNESLSEWFGSHWESKVKTNAYYKRQWKCFLTLHACQPVVGDSQNQNMNLSLPIIGALWQMKPPCKMLPVTSVYKHCQHLPL